MFGINQICILYKFFSIGDGINSGPSISGRLIYPSSSNETHVLNLESSAQPAPAFSHLPTAQANQASEQMLFKHAELSETDPINLNEQNLSLNSNSKSASLLQRTQSYTTPNSLAVTLSRPQDTTEVTQQTVMSSISRNSAAPTCASSNPFSSLVYQSIR